MGNPLNRSRSMVLCSVIGGAFLLSAAGISRADACPASLSAKDRQAVRDVLEAYRMAWLRGDARGVLSTFTPDAVLLPAHGAAPIVGTDAITRYWWPPNGPPTTITKLDITAEDLGGDCQIAYVSGRDDVSWTVLENGATVTHGHPGTYLDVMVRMKDGSWRIARHMWDDGPSK